MTSLQSVLLECSTTAGLAPEEQSAWYEDVLAFFDAVVAEVASGEAIGIVLQLSVASWRVANRELVADPHGRVPQAWRQLHQHLAADYAAAQAAHDLLRDIERFLDDDVTGGGFL
jgi:hypothetical protein